MNLSTQEESSKEYKSVKAALNDSDEEQQLSPSKQQSKLVIQEEVKQFHQVEIEHVQEPPKPINLNADHVEIDIRIKKQWIEKTKNIPEPKYAKKAQIDLKQPILFTVEKKQTKHKRSFFATLFSPDFRYLYILEGYLYILHLKNDILWVKSVTSLQRLFKIICNQNTLTLCFYNVSQDKRQPPLIKTYELQRGMEQKSKILMKMRSELNKLGQDFETIR